MKVPHLHIIVDLGWFGVRTGAAFYEQASDSFRPAFLEIMVLDKWRFTFEFGRMDSVAWGRRKW